MGLCFRGVLTGAALERGWGKKGGKVVSVRARLGASVYLRERKGECVAPFCVCVRTSWRACMFGTDGKTSRGLRCNWKRSEVVIAF